MIYITRFPLVFVQIRVQPFLIKRQMLINQIRLSDSLF
ncbi:hypothetical protein V529_26780 [Bacillus velezensis SQR9]|nr:hypothetical protein V529_26780 [Bacillus velezensis SQR9]